MKYIVMSKSSEETMALGMKLAALLNAGDVVLLEGDLGAGKTTLTKGIARGLNISEKVNSPTFNIMKLYLKGTIPLFHIDAYRLENNTDDIGLNEFIGTEGISVIEWPRFIPHLLPKESLTVTMTHATLNERTITFEGRGRYVEIIKALGEVTT